jgi:hypothetical protein
VIAAASAEAPAGGETSTAYVVYVRSMLFTASNIAAWVIATMRDCHPVLMPTDAAARMAVSFQSVTASAWARVVMSKHNAHARNPLRRWLAHGMTGETRGRMGMVPSPFARQTRSGGRSVMEASRPPHLSR